MTPEVFPISQGAYDKGLPVSVRVTSVNYLAILLLTSFISAFLLYAEWEFTSLVVLGIVWTVVPLLALFDRISFDGKRIRRTGILPRIWAHMTATRDRIKLSDIEMVQTNVLRTVKRGRNLNYTYRTVFSGKGKAFVIVSGRPAFRRFIETVLPRINEELLDHRSIELRDHLMDRAEVTVRARAAKIPPADILEGALNDRNAFKLGLESKGLTVDENDEQGAGLYLLANELKVSGLLPQAVEAFRRAIRFMPSDGRLLFDFAMCLRTYAAVMPDRNMEKRALAMMRLAERRAGDDGELLARIGEGYFQFGEWQRSGTVFRKAIERAGTRFRALIGLAEVALHEGKIAHVIHNFSAASELAGNPAQRRWTTQEIEYFSRLNSDEEYMELEIGRMNLLDTLEAVKNSTLRIAIFGVPVIVLGILMGDVIVANIGWAVSIISLIIWAVSLTVGNMLSTRIPFDLVEED